MPALTRQHKLKSLFYVTMSGIATYAGISFYRNDPVFYKNVVMPLVHLLDAEKAHRLAIFINKHQLIPATNYTDPDCLKVEVFGTIFKNPIGIAAGFDKDGEAVLGLKNIGFGFIEIGSVTPKPQDGNEKPRVFRLPEDLAVINRYGFNNSGHDAVFERLKAVTLTDKFSGVLGVNLGKNKTSEDAVDDYIRGIKKFGPLSDYLVINISSPNTPGLRSWQNKDALKKLLKAAVEARNNLPNSKKPPLLLKLAPDLTLEEKRDICNVILTKECQVDGLIITNTTVERPIFLKNKIVQSESGGLSGRPIRDKSTEMIAEMYRLTKGRLPIIGVGGVFTGQDAYDKIKAGSCLVQLYTSLVYEGPPVVTKIKKELVELLVKDGYRNVSEAVGKDVKL